MEIAPANLTGWISIVQSVVSIFGIPIALLGLRNAALQAQKSRNLTVVMQIQKTFMENWHPIWSNYVNEIEQRISNRDEIPEKDLSNMFEILNWLDWIGHLSLSKNVTDMENSLNSIKSQVKKNAYLMSPYIGDDINLHGSAYWAGVLHIVKILKIENPPAVMIKM